MSGYTEEVVHRGRELPANLVFLEKPFTARTLSTALADALPKK
jgi:hypothetical protein